MPAESPIASASRSTCGTWPSGSARTSWRTSWRSMPRAAPQPRLRCNEKIKFAALLDKALALGFDAVATGHYAQIVQAADGRRELHRAVDAARTSPTCSVSSTRTNWPTLFPLGDTTKPAIREEAAARGFSVAKKPDSHDICFIPDGDTRGFLAGRLGEQPGELVTTDGEVVGTHRRFLRFHRRQRRGLGIDRSRLDGEPRYVVDVDAPTNRVVIGTAELLGVRQITGEHARWCGPAPIGTIRAVRRCAPTAREVGCAAYQSPGGEPR